MTLSEMATFVCTRLNQSDATSVGLCKDFLKRRYEMVWAHRNWLDSLINVTASLTDTSTGILDLPATVGRIIAIRAGGDHILVPVDSPQVMQMDPTVFERSGTPIAFEEYTDGDTRKIRFFPIPSEVTALLINGKRPLVQLADATSSILRDSDNTIIAYATADMLERQRQYGKAQVKVTEANALLSQMVENDTGMTAHMPRVIPDVSDRATGSDLGWGGRWANY